MYRIGVGFGGGGQSRDKVGRAGVGSGVIWGSRMGDNKKKKKRKRKEKKQSFKFLKSLDPWKMRNL